ncbi:hypothetical protein Ade02nite_86590 [Paractinoplanes deccanensis]|uniref:Fibronectin type-III domain-containing protein n=1 Tax=Paractinoplanes deccanensis TaxID=113561 RepID=A0ABQ3YJ28_9ACTN|nr:hypothetical protein Ade02nite_86590 [Actinoplanes deccanensis]
MALVPLLLVGACGKSDTPESSGTSAPAAPWLSVEEGSRTPSPVVTYTGSPRPGLPPVSFLPTSSACAVPWPQSDAVLIPIIVTPGSGSFRVQWPNQYGRTYRVTAVPQELVSGAQPEPVWQTVTTGTECTGSATISGLQSGKPYVVWLDAPDTPRRADGSRDLYSGKSGVVRPQ